MFAPVRAALADGSVHADQAAVIVNAVEAIPMEPNALPAHADAPAVLKTRAVHHLLDLAQDHDAQQLKLLGRRILDVVAPEVGEAAEAKELADEEAAAERKVTLILREGGNGTSTGRFTIPTAAAQALRKQLMALAAPKHRAATRTDGPVTDKYRTRTTDLCTRDSGGRSSSGSSAVPPPSSPPPVVSRRPSWSRWAWAR